MQKEKDRDTHPLERPTRLKDANDIQRLIARVINDLLRNRIDSTKAGKVGYLCNIMLHSLETQELQRRIEEIEEFIKSTEKKS